MSLRNCSCIYIYRFYQYGSGVSRAIWLPLARYTIKDPHLQLIGSRFDTNSKHPSSYTTRHLEPHKTYTTEPYDCRTQPTDIDLTSKSRTCFYTEKMEICASNLHPFNLFFAGSRRLSVCGRRQAAGCSQSKFKSLQ